MKMKRETHLVVSVRDTQRSREAHNLFATGLSETVRPWFDDVKDERVSRAIDELEYPSRRERAARFLGLEIIQAPVVAFA